MTVYDELAQNLAGTQGDLNAVRMRSLAGGRARLGGARARYTAALRGTPGMGADPNALAFNMAELERSLAQSGALDELGAENTYADAMQGARRDYMGRVQQQRQFDESQALERWLAEQARRERIAARRSSAMGSLGQGLGTLGLLLAL